MALAGDDYSPLAGREPFTAIVVVVLVVRVVDALDEVQVVVKVYVWTAGHRVLGADQRRQSVGRSNPAIGFAKLGLPRRVVGVGGIPEERHHPHRLRLRRVGVRGGELECRSGRLLLGAEHVKHEPALRRALEGGAVSPNRLAYDGELGFTRVHLVGLLHHRFREVLNVLPLLAEQVNELAILGFSGFADAQRFAPPRATLATPSERPSPARTRTGWPTGPG